MAPPTTTSFPIAAQPRREIFDAWNSSSTGHQRAENRLSGSTSWRDSRTAKLAEQFKSGLSGGKRRIADTVGAGSESFEKEERTANGGWKRGVVRDRASGQVSLWESFGVSKGGNVEKHAHKRARLDSAAGGGEQQSVPILHTLGGTRRQPPGRSRNPSVEGLSTIAEACDRTNQSRTTQTPQSADQDIDFDDALLASFSPNSTTFSSPEAQRQVTKRRRTSHSHSHPPSPTDHPPDDDDETIPTLLTSATDANEDQPPPQIFRNLTVYINGSTYPLISDHKLKHILSTHGANLSVSLGRRTVTHVVLGVPASSSAAGFASTPNARGRGAGGALAAGKIQREVDRVRSAGAKGVRYVSAEWVVQCVRSGRRVPEGAFEVVRTGGARARGVGDMLGGGVLNLDNRQT